MEISVEVSEGLERRLTVQVPVEKVDKEFKERIKKLTKTAKIDGFRPGKVPAQIIEKRYGDSVHSEILEKVIQETLFEAISQEKLNPAGQPKIDIKQFERGKPLEYIAIFEIYPKINLVDLNNIEIETLKSEVTDEDVEKTINSLQKQYVNWEVVDRPAQKDDQVVVDIEGTIDGKSFDGGQASEMPVVIGSNTMIAGFEEGFIGAKEGDELELNLTFPKEYHMTDVAGKPVLFKAKVHKVSEANLPKLDEEFLSKFGVKEGGIDALRKNLRKKMEKELEDGLKSKNKHMLFSKLLELNKIELPKSLIKTEIENLRQQAQHRFAEYSDSNKTPDLPDSLFENQAIRRVALGLLVAEVVKLHDIKADPDIVRKVLENIASAYEYPDQIIEWYYADKQRLAPFELVAIEDQVMRKLFESAVVKGKVVSFDEAMKPLTE